MDLDAAHGCPVEAAYLGDAFTLNCWAAIRKAVTATNRNGTILGALLGLELACTGLYPDLRILAHAHAIVHSHRDSETVCSEIERAFLRARPEHPDSDAVTMATLLQEFGVRIDLEIVPIHSIEELFMRGRYCCKPLNEGSTPLCEIYRKDRGYVPAGQWDRFINHIEDFFNLFESISKSGKAYRSKGQLKHAGRQLCVSYGTLRPQNRRWGKCVIPEKLIPTNLYREIADKASNLAKERKGEITDILEDEA